MVRTDYVYVLPYRVPDQFAYMAEEDGKVISVSNKYIKIRYKSGTELSKALGKWYSRPEGGIAYLHKTITNLSKGQSFKKGDPICWDEMFFEIDWLDGKSLVYKQGTTLTTALLEDPHTHEDSSAITKDAAAKLATNTIHAHSYVVSFTQNVHNLVKPGDKITVKQPFFIAEETISGASLFDKETLESIKRLSNLAPTPKFSGTVDRVEIFYRGDKKDMTDSLRKLVEESDKQIAISRGKKGLTGKVDGTYSIQGKVLPENHAEIKIYLSVVEQFGSGDKTVFSNQMKSITSEVLPYKIKTKDGLPVDAVFSYRSVMARIVRSSDIIGTTTTLLKVIKRKAIQIYRNNK